MHATTVRSRRQNCALTALAASLLAASGLAQAHYFCVSTAQDFQNALTQSSDGGAYNGEDNDLYMVHGTYKTGAATNNAPFFFYSPNSTHYMSIAGGYAAGCSAPTPQTPPTTLDGQNHTGVLTLRSTYGDMTVRNLTLQNGDSAEPGAGLQVNYLISVNGSVLVKDTIIRNNHSSVDAGGLYASGGGFDVEVFNNLITGNSTDGFYGGGYVTGYSLYNEVWGNTVVQNTSAAASNPVGGLYCGGTTFCQVYNNIFWNNTNIGLYLGDGDAYVDFNDYGTLGGAAPMEQTGNVSVNPKFVDASAGNFHLAGDSPLLGMSPYALGGNDLDGNLLPSSGETDLGAYEETIFLDGMDGS